MFDALVRDLSERYGLGDRSHELFGLLVAYIFNDRRGGFAGFVEGFREQGHGERVEGWIGAREGQQPLNTGDVNMVFGQGLLTDWGQRLGVSRATVAAAVAGVLPRLVSALTAGGRVPGDVSEDRSLAETSATLPAAATTVAATAPIADPAPLRRGEAAFDERSLAAGPDDPGFIVPGEEARAIDASSPRGHATHAIPSAPGIPDPALRTPLAARHAQEARDATSAMEPAEQRIAEMMAAMSGEKSEAQGLRRTARPEKPDNWRLAVHRPVKKPRRLGWLWFLLALVAIVAGVAYAWQLGALDPLIEQVNPHLRQFEIWIPTRGSMS